MPLLQIGGRLCSVGGGLGSGAAASGGGGGGSPDNTMSLTNVSGSTVTNQHLPFARFFAQGEIADAPAVLLDGVAQTAGVNVKTRWPDGSAQHCKIKTIIASLTNNVAKEMTFENNASNSTTAITKTSMLADYDFDAVISYTVGGVAKTASARTMLTNDHYVVVDANPVATTIILADDSSSRTYDKGWFTNTAIKPFRPRFIATFWAASNRVDISAIGGCVNAEELSDITGNLAITKGSASPTSVYTKTALTTYVGTRWIVRFWIGTAPVAAVHVNHNLAYLKDTLAWPNFDTTLTLDTAAITAMYSFWTSEDKDLYDPSAMETHMGNAGTRPEIGPVPTWTLLWLYSGDYRMREVALGTADRACAWPLHYQETATGKRLQRADAAGNSGYGRPVSLTDRKTTCLAREDLLNTYGDVGDRMKIVAGADGGVWATSEVHGWSPKNSHAFDPFYTQYMLTGDPFYLEEMHYWNSAFAHFGDGQATTQGYGRGPTGAEGVIEEEPRGHAWMVRNRANAWLATPDGDPFKDYLYTLMEDHTAAQEGKWGITTGEYNGTTIWTWAHTHLLYLQTNALHFIDLGGSAKVWGQAPWMVNYYIFALGRNAELGLPGAGILEWLAAWLAGIVTSPDMNPWQIQDYYMPAGPDAGAATYNTSYFQTWADVFAADDVVFSPNVTPQNEVTGLSQPSVAAPQSDHPYEMVASCASAYITPFTDGAAAQAWIKTNVYDAMGGKGYSPKWCILPRS